MGHFLYFHMQMEVLTTFPARCQNTGSIKCSIIEGEGRGAMARTRSFANVTACRAVSNPAWCRISEKYHVSPLSILGHYVNVVSLGKTLYPHMLHLTQV